jgi:hypothetical protein
MSKPAIVLFLPNIIFLAPYFRNLFSRAKKLSNYSHPKFAGFVIREDAGATLLIDRKRSEVLADRSVLKSAQNLLFFGCPITEGDRWNLLILESFAASGGDRCTTQ